MKTCIRCDKTFTTNATLRCGHFVCSKCYCALKENRPIRTSNKCGCPSCGRNMIRKSCA